MSVVAGHVDPRSGQKCAWANGGIDCKVPGCEFPDERCICVKRERESQRRSAEATPPGDST